MKGLERYYFKKSRTPAWASQKRINAIYKKSKVMGERYCVDHIVPLVSPYVCGLHVENNLKIITNINNILKSNTNWPDMWQENYQLNLDNCLNFQLKLF